MPKALGGGGLSRVGMAACYEEMNRSIFGPVVFNCAAPDDGNMMVLEKVGTEAQKDRWLQPIIDGEVQLRLRDDRAATAPAATPRMTYTEAEPAGERPLAHPRPQVVHHRRRRRQALHPDGAHLATIARKGLTAFLFHRDQPGLAHRAPHPDHGPGGAWRALRARLRRAGDPRREPADRRRRRAQADADPPRHRAADALHALDRARQALRWRSPWRYVATRESLRRAR